VASLIGFSKKVLKYIAETFLAGGAGIRW